MPSPGPRSRLAEPSGGREAGGRPPRRATRKAAAGRAPSTPNQGAITWRSCRLSGARPIFVASASPGSSSWRRRSAARSSRPLPPPAGGFLAMTGPAAVAHNATTASRASNFLLIIRSLSAPFPGSRPISGRGRRHEAGDRDAQRIAWRDGAGRPALGAQRYWPTLPAPSVPLRSDVPDLGLRTDTVNPYATPQTSGSPGRSRRVTVPP